MKRFILAFLCHLACLTVAPGQTGAEKKATVAYLRALQTKDGGFLPAAPGPKPDQQLMPSLRATTAALRALKYFGGEVPAPAAAARFVRRCFIKARGAFSDQPRRSTPEPIITAVGLMAVVELKMARDEYGPGATKFLESHAQTFEEIRMAAAGFEAIGQRPDKASAWIKEVTKAMQRDGTYGQGAGQARATASLVVTVLRLGGEVAERPQVVKALRQGQRPDGGFGKTGGAGSDLETCYRVMRAFAMLKEKPADVARLRRFVARCRNANGGYGLTPGQPAQVAATYFASKVLHWLD